MHIVRKDLIAEMNEVGIGGQYITHEHTLKHCRDTVYARTFNLKSRSDWMKSDGQDGILDNAEEILDDIIKNHEAPSPPQDVAKEIDKIIEAADKKLN